jgi:uncharacterized protein (TIGR03435 family)
MPATPLFACRHRALALPLLLISASAIAQTPAASPAASAPNPTFEVAAIKPSKPDATGDDWDRDENRLSIQNYTLRDLIRQCYRLHANSQVIGGPAWIGHLHVDISAKIDDDEMARFNKLNHDDRTDDIDQMLQSLLAERFHLKLHQETRPLPAYGLVLDGPSKLKAPVVDPTRPSPGHSMMIHNTHLEARSISMDHLAASLSGFRELEDRVVVNRTALPGNFDFTLDWSPDRPSTPSDSTSPGLFTALHEQLGLKLQHETDAVPVVIVESATPPDFD